MDSRRKRKRKKKKNCPHSGHSVDPERYLNYRTIPTTQCNEESLLHQLEIFLWDSEGVTSQSIE
jgi:hypothetical protein